MNEQHRRKKFENIYDQFVKDKTVYASRRSKNPETTADIVAETFMICWRRLNDIPDPPDAKFWLYRTARGVISNAYRKKANSEQLGKGLSSFLEKHGQDDFSSSTTDQLFVREELNKLDDDDKEIIMLKYWDGMKAKEIAEIIGISTVAARKRLNRASKLLKVRLENDEDQNWTINEH